MNHDRSKQSSVGRNRSISRHASEVRGSTMRVGARLLLYVLDTEVPDDHQHTRRVKVSGNRGM